MLEQAKINVIPHAFPDHHRFTATDILFDDEKIILMTEKDAVKCERFVNNRHWYVRMQTQLDERFKTTSQRLFKSIVSKTDS